MVDCYAIIRVMNILNFCDSDLMEIAVLKQWFKIDLVFIPWADTIHICGVETIANIKMASGGCFCSIHKESNW